MGMPANLHLVETGIGDIRLQGKAHLATLGREDQYDLGLSAGLTLPTGHTGGRAYLGDKTVTGRITAIGTIDFGPVRAGGNLGILIRETSNSFATELGPQLLYGAAADYSFDKRPTSSWRSPDAAASTSSSSSTTTSIRSRSTWRGGGRSTGCGR